MAGNPPSAESIFFSALEKSSPTEQAAYVNEACGDDDALRQRIEKLLDSHPKIGGFLEEPLNPTTEVDGGRIYEGPGTMIGLYKLRQQIGEGGFGVVFMAEQLQPVRRKVALKIIKPGMDTHEVVARFESERQALAMMDHPNIARVLDAGATETGRPYFVMDLVKGVPITEFCDKNQLGTRQRLELFVTVCQAVQHAHQKGVIHRDIKPANIMVTLHDGTPVPKVIDFGIAKAIGQELTVRTLFTSYGQMIGTPQYMSPEQAEMSGLDVDTRSDVYSLGVLLYELLTGRTPLEADRLRTASYAEVQRMICEEEPTKPSAHLSTLGDELTIIARHRSTDPKHLCQLIRGDLDWIVMKALEKDRRRRYETANALAMDVQRNLHDEPVAARPPSAAYRLRKFALRHKSAFTAGVLVALALLLGSVVSTWQAIRATVAEGLAQNRFENEKTLRQQADEAKREAKRRLFEARLSEARAGRRSGLARQRVASLSAIVEAAQLARELGLESDTLLELRNEAIACLALVDVRTVKDVADYPPGSSGLAFDDDLDVYARGDSKGNITVHLVADDQQIGALPGPSDDGDQSTVAAIIFSPDGEVLAARYHPLDRVWLWNWRSKGVFKLPYAIDSGAFTFSPDGSLLALGQPDGTITLHDLRSGEPLRTLGKVDVKPMGLSFSPDGYRLAVSSWWGQQVLVLNVMTGQVLHKFPAPAGMWSAAWHPDGALLAFGCEDRNLYIWDTTSGQQHTILRGHQTGANVAAFAAEGDLLVSWAWDGTTRLWDPWVGREVVRFAGHTQVSGDGRRLANHSGRKISISEILCADELRALPRMSPVVGGDYGNGSFSPDGRWLALGTGTGARLWDLVRAREVDLPPVPPARDIDFHPSRQEIFASGDGGLYRWPWRVDGDVFRIGKAEKLAAPGSTTYVSLDAAGSVLAAANYQGAWALHLDDGSQPAHRLSHASATYVAISPNGRWAATGTFRGRGVKVWEIPSRAHLKTLIPDDSGTRMAFSPDARWLVTSTPEEFRIWQTGSWESVQKLPRDQMLSNEGIAFSPDSRMLALTLSLSGVRLLDPATGAVIAELQADGVGPISWMAFSPDGGQLVIEAVTGNVWVWDLRLIRTQLREIGLEWDLPDYATPRGGDDELPPPVTRVEFDDYPDGLMPQPYLEKGSRLASQGRWKEASAAYTTALALDPTNHWTWHDASVLYLQTRDTDGYRHACREMLARFSDTDQPNVAERVAKSCCLAPGGVEDYEQVLRLAELAVTGSESHGDYRWFALARGMVDYRAGRFADSLEWFDRSLSPGSELAVRDGLAQLFLAMAHNQLGEADEAAQAMDKARDQQRHISPLDASQIDNWPDCLRFHIVRREAEELLIE
jgi:serine/threonine protein kinase/WD40 repeat protein